MREYPEVQLLKHLPLVVAPLALTPGCKFGFEPLSKLSLISSILFTMVVKESSVCVR